jgi:SpoVK/Ycf46/Vps4 family AAA+-type ATPase
VCDDAALAPDRLVLVLTPQDVVAPLADRIDPLIDLPLPDVATRRALWEQAVPGAADWPAVDLDQLAVTHRVTVAELHAVAALGVEDAASAARAVRSAGRGALGGLAQRLACTFTLEDLVTPPVVRAAIEDLLFEARERLVVWDDPELRRLFPLGTGLLALFCGPPGTGKTMAAQVIARELSLDLYRIDLATVVSKYVGETARNLDRVLAHAARMDVVLFFDEADALFGKRTDIRDAHDRYANTDTNYLLQAVEGYPGIALLATNRKGNVDAAFLRRLRHVLEFPAPDAGLRLRLWEALVAAIGGDAARVSTGAALPTFAASFDLSGAQIKYAVLHSLYTARREQATMRVRHLVGGVERELLKEGRGLGRAERERLLAFDKGAAA